MEPNSSPDRLPPGASPEIPGEQKWSYDSFMSKDDGCVDKTWASVIPPEIKHHRIAARGFK
jgi:hypothetical protein